MGAIAIIDAFWGDAGKGLVSAHYAKKYNAVSVYRAGVGSNAEHGMFVNGEYKKVNQLPLGWMLNPEARIRIGSGVAIDPEKLLAEIKKYKLQDRVLIDYRCPVIESHHIEAEKTSKGMNSIGSTFSGSGYARADFILRKAKQAKDIQELQPYLADLITLIRFENSLGDIVLESSQGTFLSLAISDDYPNTTSDNVTVSAVLDDVNLSPKGLGKTVLVVKALPTREGKGGMGNSEEFSVLEMQALDLIEDSSIGGVPRRKAKSIDFNLLAYASLINEPDEIALTFVEQYDREMQDVVNPYTITKKTKELIKKIEDSTNAPVKFLNTGKDHNSVMFLE